MQRLSVIIPNYNYARFLRAAIESALALDWDDVEVIVVDDGSTDESAEVMAGFGARIQTVYQSNAGPRVACNVGFARSSGDVVIFLDSDDILEPDIARRVAEVWGPDVSKVQVQMTRIDSRGDSLGSVFPRHLSKASPQAILHWMSSTAEYPTPPGSGNVYARWFLDRLLPLDNSCGDATDSACLAAAPFLGNVITIARPLVRYRVHPANRSGLGHDDERFRLQVRRAHQRHLYAYRLLGGESAPFSSTALFRGRHLLQMRIADRRLNPGAATIPSDSRLRMLSGVFSTVAAPGPDPLIYRLAMSAWCLTTLLAPSPLARRLIGARFGHHRRRRPELRTRRSKHSPRSAAS